MIDHAAGFALSRRALLTGAVAATAILPALAGPESANSQTVDDLVEHFRRAFDVPGIALAVVEPGKLDRVRGYGRRRLDGPAPVDGATIFAIASNSKAFTATAIALLVEEGKLGWDEPVARYLPDFRMYDSEVTRMMTVRDLLVHRSGLGLGQGDLMYWPETIHTRAEVVHGLRYLKPVRAFRTGYDYDNVLYVTAGALVDVVTGSWEDFVTQRLFVPVGMRDAAPTIYRVRGTNVAGRHARIGGELRGIGPMQAIAAEQFDQAAPSGGVHASARDIARWMRTQLSGGVSPESIRLWSDDSAREMWTPQTIIATGTGPTPTDPGRALFETYALGRFVQDYRGERLIWHYGALAGQVTMTAMLPERGVGIAILTNAEEMDLLYGLRNALLDRFIRAPEFDWLTFAQEKAARTLAESLAKARNTVIEKPLGGPSLPLPAYVGRYRDPWYGEIRIEQRPAGLYIDFTKTPALKGPLEPWGQDVFRTRFPDKTMEDAVLRFKLDAHARVVEIRLEALSPLADFSFDYQDLLLTPLASAPT